MKTTLDQATRDELISRIGNLNENSQTQWGKMNVSQMLRHCTAWEELISGRQKFKQAFVGRIFGKMALRGMLKDDAPLRRNTPTSPEFKITRDGGDVRAERERWISLLQDHGQFSHEGIEHPSQLGYMAYKHTDHHLRQFGC